MVIIEQHEHYQKTGYRNKYRLLAANGTLLLSIPIAGGRGTKDKIRDVKIDYSTQWQKQHWRTLESAYNKSAFFLYYSDFLRDFFLGKHFVFLWDFNLEAMHWLNKQLKNPCVFELTEAFLHSREYPLYKDGRGMEKREGFSNGQFSEYFQVFGQRFIPNLCILDMLFNVGPATSQQLKCHQ
jgi:hypothetical protein